MAIAVFRRRLVDDYRCDGRDVDIDIHDELEQVASTTARRFGFWRNDERGNDEHIHHERHVELRHIALLQQRYDDE
jgi:hypothetical protein